MWLSLILSAVFFIHCGAFLAKGDRLYALLMCLLGLYFSVSLFGHGLAACK